VVVATAKAAASAAAATVKATVRAVAPSQRPCSSGSPCSLNSPSHHRSRTPPRRRRELQLRSGSMRPRRHTSRTRQVWRRSLASSRCPHSAALVAAAAETGMVMAAGRVAASAADVGFAKAAARTRAASALDPCSVATAPLVEAAAAADVPAPRSRASPKHGNGHASRRCTASASPGDPRTSHSNVGTAHVRRRRRGASRRAGSRRH